MNLTRLVLLGLLAEQGERHGPQLRRDVELRKADQWAGVGIGSLHRELRGMAGAGLIEAVRTERVANRPERTVYRITEDGLRELNMLREVAIGDLQVSADAMSVALIFTAAQDPVGREALLGRHRRAVLAELERLSAERADGLARGYLQPSISPTQAASFRRAELHVRAELEWHDECDRLLTAATTETPSPESAE
jgi:DNA-binding PadR family transcriptional regulator